jgi:hypothetical protein
MRQSIVIGIVAGMVVLASPSFAADDAPDFQSPELRKGYRLIQTEIARDREFVAHRVNNARLSRIRDRLRGDIAAKRKLIEIFVDYDEKLLADVIAVLRKSLADETWIVDGGSSGHRAKRYAESKLEENIPEKQKALNILTRIAASPIY